MSVESARAFANRVRNDPALRSRIEGAATDQARLDIARAEGFDFTRDDVLKMRDELTDDDLDRVAGGGSGACMYIDA